MKKLRIEYCPNRCIGNGNCVLFDPLDFSLLYEKAVLHNATKKDNLFVLEKEFESEEKIVQAAQGCPVNAIKVVDLKSDEIIVGVDINATHTKKIVAQYDDNTEFVLDPAGYFLIKINSEKQDIEVGFCTMKNNLILHVTGKKPIDIYHTIINTVGLHIRKDHCAYLGRELQKAYIAIQKGISYIQDDELLL